MIHRFLNRFDKFAPNLNLNYKGDIAVGSFPGAILTLLAYLLILIFICQRSVVLFGKEILDDV